MTTYQDLIDLMIDYWGADTSEAVARYARQAVQTALREVSNQRRWSYYIKRLRINTVAPYSTGTVEYIHTGGTYERQLTLTSGTWPSWAGLGIVVISSMTYEVFSRISDTVLVLTEASNPGADVAAGTAYVIYRDTFPLPTDFMSMDEPVQMNFAWVMKYVHPDTWLSQQRLYRGQMNPRVYTIMSDSHYLGVMAIKFYPGPDQVYSVDANYQRRPRPVTVDNYTTGTAASTLSSLTVTGSGTQWTPDMAGSAIRFSASGNRDAPTGLMGANPYYIERMVMSVESATSLTIDAITGVTMTGVKYNLSSPLDMEDMMLNLLRVECYRAGRTARRTKATDEEREDYERTRRRAWDADQHAMQRRHEGAGEGFRPRIIDMPLGSDQ